MESMKTVSAMLISASRLFREGMKQLLAGSPYRIDVEATSAQEAVERLRGGGDVELVLFDLFAARKDVIEQIGVMRNIAPKARLVVLSDDAAIIKLAQVPGSTVDGYLLKDTSPDALLQMLNLTMLGERVFPTSLVQMLIEGRLELDGLTPSGAAVGLSEREIEILRHLVEGASNKSIGNRLEIAESTVKVHMKTILRKIRMKNRTQAAIWAVEHGIEANPAPAAAGGARSIAGKPARVTTRTRGRSEEGAQPTPAMALPER